MPEVELLWQFQTLNAAHSEMGLSKGQNKDTSWQKEHTHTHTQPIDRQLSHSCRLVSGLGSGCQHDIKIEHPRDTDALSLVLSGNN